jgi:hypothetical protein
MDRGQSIWTLYEPKVRSASIFNPKSEVDRGELAQSAGRESHSTGVNVF